MSQPDFYGDAFYKFLLFLLKSINILLKEVMTQLIFRHTACLKFSPLSWTQRFPLFITSDRPSGRL
jgi:hypothetical protein